MKRLLVSALALSMIGGAALALPRHGPPPGWRPGGHVPREYWGRQHEVDWRSRHLPPPRRGYHWVQNGDNYVMAAVAGGLIASVIAANH